MPRHFRLPSRHTFADIDARQPELIGHACEHVRNQVNLCHVRGTFVDRAGWA
jgi:hypothetical protein